MILHINQAIYIPTIISIKKIFRWISILFLFYLFWSIFLIFQTAMHLSFFFKTIFWIIFSNLNFLCDKKMRTPLSSWSYKIQNCRSQVCKWVDGAIWQFQFLLTRIVIVVEVVGMLYFLYASTHDLLKWSYIHMTRIKKGDVSNQFVFDILFLKW